ncbi:hypothetical protein BGX24_009569 [Mortierella sp. AD032]|nr:hypothetical protein BGX24_009569 [Mortierella sp. AD032]
MAIDFGMKETRVAFAYGLHDKEVVDITSWPRDSKRIAAMSVSLYKKDSTEIKDWGYKAHVEKMKPTGTIADYLRMVHEYAVREALRHVADHFRSDFQLNNFHFRYCLTVPARWSDRAKETMRQAAIEAGLVEASDPPQRLMLISEDEAKALYCLRKMDQFEFMDKDRFLICDTNEDHEGVDLVVFEVSESSAGQAQRLKEVARSHGAVCASTVLDRHMRKLLEVKLRSYLPNLPVNVIGELMEIFRDVVKLGFDGSEDQFIQFPYVLELDDEEEDTGVDDGYLFLTASDLKEKVFEPAVKIVLESIRVMLQQQERLGGNCEAIFMFGEFGSSTYMYKRVGQEFKGQLELISIPPRQELGTVRGAVFAGLNPNAVAGFHPKPKGDKFTKVSYASKGSAEICDIDTRPKTKNYIRYKWAPTVSSYKKGSTEIQDWGYKAYAEVAKSPKDYCMLRNFKMQLDETIEVPPFENGFSPLKVITDYLRKLHEYAVEEVLEKNMSSEFKSDNFRYSLTVPARWSNRSKNTMRQAAIGAGLIEAGDPFNRLMILTEDDAKAMYCLQKIDVMQFKDKDRFIICDASEGGGVDAVVYEVGESSLGQTQRLQEVARTHSSDCGSDILEVNIETYLERKLRKHRKVITARAWESLMYDFWHWIRGIFKPAHNEEHVYLHLPNGFLLDHDPDIGLEDGMLCFSCEDLTEVFEPAAADVLEVIWDQLLKQEKVGGTCRAIFMFGEFGSCRYMLDRACQEFKERVELVAAPPYPDDLANVHGAVYAGLDSLLD